MNTLQSMWTIFRRDHQATTAHRGSSTSNATCGTWCIFSCSLFLPPPRVRGGDGNFFPWMLSFHQTFDLCSLCSLTFQRSPLFLHRPGQIFGQKTLFWLFVSSSGWHTVPEFLQHWAVKNEKGTKFIEVQLSQHFTVAHRVRKMLYYNTKANHIREGEVGRRLWLKQNRSGSYYTEEFKETKITLKYVQILKIVLAYIQEESRRWNFTGVLPLKKGKWLPEDFQRRHERQKATQVCIGKLYRKYGKCWGVQLASTIVFGCTVDKSLFCKEARRKVIQQYQGQERWETTQRFGKEKQGTRERKKACS